MRCPCRMGDADPKDGFWCGACLEAIAVSNRLKEDWERETGLYGSAVRVKNVAKQRKRKRRIRSVYRRRGQA